MAIFRLARMLTLAAWESELGNVDDPLEGGLQLDFANVEFADFGALARALLLVDAAVRRKVSATIILPVKTLTASEERLAEQGRTNGNPEADDYRRGLVRGARARGDVLAFMHHIGFLDAMRGPGWLPEAVRIVSEAPAALSPYKPGQNRTTADLTDPRDAPYRTRRLLPFRWLEPVHGDPLPAAESFAVGLEELGLSYADARALSQTVLTELVENAAEYGQTDHPVALVGAILLDAETFVLRQHGIQPALRELAECATADGSRVLRLIVADTGPDIVTRLAPTQPQAKTHEVILQAFEKWPATNRQSDRDARSLWRVNRMVRSYRGSIVVRTNDALAGYVYAHALEGVQITEPGLGRFPGSLFELTILTGPRSPRPPLTWDDHPAGGDQDGLRWVDFAFNTKRDLGDDDRLRVDLVLQR